MYDAHISVRRRDIFRLCLQNAERHGPGSKKATHNNNALCVSSNEYVFPAAAIDRLKAFAAAKHARQIGLLYSRKFQY